jgi:imidazoleglycerol-phosphate dehydratase/histidinol-phosphatase
MKKVLFIDRDGTILTEPEDKQLDHIDKTGFLPGVICNLKKIAGLDYELVMASNQDGLGTDSFPEEDFWPVQNMMLKTLKSEGVEFDDILIDPTMPHENAPTRKPGTGMFTRYMNGEYDLSASYVIGDRATDAELAHNLGAKSIIINGEGSIKADYLVDSWDEIWKILKYPPRIGRVKRVTNETQIEVEINLDGNGKSAISTGIGFFDHMLELFSRHSEIDLTVRVNGDLYVDEHHTTEDTALALGEAFAQALGDKRGIERYGFLLPMEDSVAEVAIDFSGRPYLKWQAEFKREMIGKMPTEMFKHFFKSFCDTSKSNLYVKAEGENEHHKIESIFKGFARAVKDAVKIDPENNKIPSTKGVL